MNPINVRRERLRRARQGAIEGAGVGAVVAVVVVLVRWVGSRMGGEEVSMAEAGGFVLILSAMVSWVYGAGRWMADRLVGAFVGATMGLFLGAVIGQEWFGYIWWMQEIGPGPGGGLRMKMEGHPTAMMTGAAIGLILGAPTGAMVEALIRRRSGRRGSGDGAIPTETPSLENHS